MRVDGRPAHAQPASGRGPRLIRGTPDPLLIPSPRLRDDSAPAECPRPLVSLLRSLTMSPVFPPMSGCRSRSTAPAGAFSIRSLNVQGVRLRSLILRDHRPARHLPPFASNIAEKTGPKPPAALGLRPFKLQESPTADNPRSARFRSPLRSTAPFSGSGPRRRLRMRPRPPAPGPARRACPIFPGSSVGTRFASK